jgi:hypothetical protein
MAHLGKTPSPKQAQQNARGLPSLLHRRVRALVRLGTMAMCMALRAAGRRQSGQGFAEVFSFFGGEGGHRTPVGRRPSLRARSVGCWPAPQIPCNTFHFGRPEPTKRSKKSFISANQFSVQSNLVRRDCIAPGPALGHPRMLRVEGLFCAVPANCIGLDRKWIGCDLVE